MSDPEPTTEGEPIEAAEGLVEERREQVRLLATAVYASGSEPLVIGFRYFLAINGDDLEIRGPVDREPNKTVFARPLQSIEGVGLGERFIISGSRPSGRPIALGFTNVMGETVDGLEQIIATQRADRGSNGTSR